jgi:hypothetical protein
LNCRHKEANKNGDDGDHHQQLNQREATPFSHEPQPWHVEPLSRKENDRKGNLGFDPQLIPPAISGNVKFTARLLN